MEIIANGAGRGVHVLTICGRKVVLPSWAHEDPTDAVDEFAVGRAWW